jgi:HSP20 family protein
MATTFMERAPEKPLEKPARREMEPFDLMRFFDREMDRMFSDWNWGWNLGRRFPWAALPQGEKTFWSPSIEVEERDGKLFVRADLPGLKKSDIKVEVTDQGLTVEGERKLEEEKKEKGYYRSERSYGRFCRTIALPEGIDTNTAKATFENGVLQVTVDLPAKPIPAARKVDIA